MARIVVEIPGERAYDVVVSAGQIDRLGAEMRAFDTNQKALIITDTEVAERYLDPAKASLKQVGYQVSVITVPAGSRQNRLNVLPIFGMPWLNAV